MLGATPHVLSMSANNFRPQFTVASVWETTCVIAGIISAHFELAPQPPVQHVFVESSFIEPDASCTSRMSGAQDGRRPVERAALEPPP